MQWKIYETQPIKWSEEQRKEIEQIAYFMWLDAGKPEGNDLGLWAQAETRYLFPQPVRTVMAEGFYYCPDGYTPEEIGISKKIIEKYGKEESCSYQGLPQQEEMADNGSCLLEE